jgi:drug/metabolite transporter (DMT)-like permease
VTRAPAASAVLLTAVAMAAFAANSLLCRMALGARLIDAASFTTIRIVCGALFLSLLVLVRHGRATRMPLDAIAAAALFGYAIAFSLAYLELSAGTGALILFGAVQVTMILAGLVRGERLSGPGWLGLLAACLGLLMLLLPGLSAPPIRSALLMAGAGIAWGIYSLRGRGGVDPLQSTASNFVWAVPLALLSLLPLRQPWPATTRGIVLAAASGAIASGLGYVMWYAALRRLQAIPAATVQLSVPVIAALGGVLLLSERLTPRLVVCAVIVLGGIATVLRSRWAALQR